MPGVPGVLDDYGVPGAVDTGLGELEMPPRRCCGGTVTVIGAVMTGAAEGIGSDTEMTMLLGGALDPGTAGPTGAADLCWTGAAD